jgi:glycosyltransferase involved in cell wall biosynthesis
LRFLRRVSADLLITSNWGAMDWAAAAGLSRLPHIHTEDGFGPDEQTRQLTRRVLTRRIVLHRSQLVLPSRTLMQLAAHTWRLPARRLVYIPNGIDTARLATAIPAELPPGGGAIIGTVAVLRPEKNIGRLVRAFARLRAHKAARLVIVGDGPERAGLEALANSLGIADAVLFTGHRTDAERWLAAFDLFVLASDTEQMPLSLLEAMAAGLPAASTDVGDVRAMLAPENGPFVVPRDDAALADAMLALLADSARARSIGAANAARAAREFDQARMFAAWRRILGLEK